MEFKESHTEKDILSIVDLLGSGVLIVVDEKPIYANNELARMFGFDHPDDILKLSSYIDMVSEHDRERIRSYATLRHTVGDAPIEYEFQGLKSDGSQFQVSNRPVSINWKGKLATLANMTDITELRRENEILEKGEREYQSTVNGLLVGVVVHDAETRILISNPEASNILGLTAEQLSGKEAIDPAWMFVNKDSTQMKIEDFPVSKVISTKEPLTNYELGIIRPEKAYVTWVNVNARPLFLQMVNWKKS